MEHERDDRQHPPGDITRLLDAWNHGDAKARDLLMPIVYGELRRRAAAQLRHESGRTLRPTDLVHETYLRLCAQNAGWKNRAQFFAVAARLMRRIIVDRARARKALKRGRGLQVTLAEGAIAAPCQLRPRRGRSGARRAVSARRAARAPGRAALLRRSHLRGDRPGARHLAVHGEPGVGARQGVAVQEVEGSGASRRLPPLLARRLSPGAPRDVSPGFSA